MQGIAHLTLTDVDESHPTPIGCSGVPNFPRPDPETRNTFGGLGCPTTFDGAIQEHPGKPCP